MKKLCILIIILLAFTSAHTQTKFGNANNEELKMTVYELDTTASAVVLRKSGRLRFVVNREGSFQYEYTEQKKIKILKPEGLDYANNALNFYVDSRTLKEEIKNLSGTTYNLEDGKASKTKLSKDNIFDENEGKSNRRKFTMPAAKVGSVIEYKYTIVSDYIYDLKDFYFQENIPIQEVDFEALIPEYFTYHLNYQGYVSLDESKTELKNETYHVTLDGGHEASQSGQFTCAATNYIFGTHNVPAVKKENFLWSVNDYITKISFELSRTNFPWSYVKPVSTTWANIDKQLTEYDSFGKNLRHAGWFKNEIEKGDLTIGRASEISEMIKSKIRWDEKDRLFSPNLKKALNEGVGSSADMNFLLINALNAAGFNAYPVVMSTRYNGIIPVTHPSISALNYIITGIQIDGKDYYTDASAKFGAWNILPEKCLVSQARSLINGVGEWVDLTKLATGNVFKQATLKFEGDKSILTVKETRNGNSAFDARNIYSSYENEEKFIQSIEESEGSTVSDFVMTGYEEQDSPLITELTETKDAQLEEFLYITPPISKIYNENPFNAETRTFPINFNHYLNYIQVIQIEIPEGYEVVEIPKAERIVLNDNILSYTYKADKVDNVVSFQIRYQVKTLFMLPEEYPYIKDFFAKMINKASEQVVMKKI